jgi:two-component system, sporulation sensor kinase E
LGVPIILENGTMFGTLCAVDPNPHYFNIKDQEKLQLFAEMIGTIVQKSELDNELYTQKAMEVNRISFISNLASGFADKLGNSLQVILGLLQLHNKNPLPYQDVFLQEVNSMRNVLNEFILTTKPSAPCKSNFIIHTLLEDLEKEFDLELSLKGIKFHLESPLDLRCHADYTQIKHALKNIVRNSIEAIGTNGRIDVQASSNESNLLKLNVSDNGEGIQDSNMDQVELPFFTTKPNSIGLGLSISKRIISAHNGTMNIRSSERGTVVQVFMPLG